jgi:hypothetical protein
VANPINFMLYVLCLVDVELDEDEELEEPLLDELDDPVEDELLEDVFEDADVEWLPEVDEELFDVLVLEEELLLLLELAAVLSSELSSSSSSSSTRAPSEDTDLPVEPEP